MFRHIAFRSMFLLSAGMMLCAVTAVAAPTSGSTRQIHLSQHGAGLGFDDMTYAASLHRVLVPAAQSGALALIDPENQHLSEWPHVVPSGSGPDHDDAGSTSAAVGLGLVFVSDHQDQAVVALDARTHHEVARARLASGPDYVRYVAPLHQVWVTEPGASQIERFAVTSGDQPTITRIGATKVKGGPESLVIDAHSGVAYTNQWKDHTVQISLQHPHVTATWPNTCEGSRGLALAPDQGLLFVGCKEGKVVALRPSRHGKVVSHAKVGAGVDIIAWNKSLKHLYAPGARSATLSVLKLGPHDALTRVATVPAARHSHCVTTDGRDHAYVCAPLTGSVIVYTDR